jgi:GT2 family glycosyltransferase
VSLARNFALSKIIGEFILPLDSDNKVRNNFISQAIPIFLKKLKVGVVYGNAMYFGAKTGIWEIGKFSKHKIIVKNYIDNCVIIRKDVLNIVGGYEEYLPHHGEEDWDLWLTILNTKYSFFYLEQITFNYRVSPNSLNHSFTKEMYNANRLFIRDKHRNLLDFRFKL